MKSFPLNIKIFGIDKFSTAFSNVSRKMEHLSRKATRLGKTLTFSLTAPLAGLATASVMSAANIETMTVQFESLTGSAEQARKTVKSLIDFTSTTPFQLDQVGRAAGMLLTSGTETSNLNDELRILGDLAAGANIPLNDMAAIFVKIQNKGKAQAEEINQLSERNIPIIQELAKLLGVATDEIFGMASKGQISAEIIRRAFISMRSEGGIFYNQSEKQSRTIAGLFSTLKDNINLASAELGTAIVETTKFKETIDKLILGVQKLTNWFKQLSPEMRNMIVYAGLIFAALGPLLFIFGQLGFAIVGISSALVTLKPLMIAGKLLFTAIAGAGIILSLKVAAVTGAIVWLIYEFVKLADMAGGVIPALKTVGGVFLDYLLWPIRKVAKAIEYVWGLMGKAPKGLSEFANADSFGENSFGQRFANEAVMGRPSIGSRTRGAIQGQQSLLQLERALKGDKAEISVIFKNPPPGMRTQTRSETNANISLEQGIAMEGAY